MKKPPKTAASQLPPLQRFLTETVKALKREGIQTENVTDDQINAIFKAVGSGELAKEALAEVFSWLSKNEDKTVQDAVAALGLKMFTEADLAPIIDRIIAANKSTNRQTGQERSGHAYGRCNEGSPWKSQS